MFPVRRGFLGKERFVGKASYTEVAVDQELEDDDDEDLDDEEDEEDDDLEDDEFDDEEDLE